MAHPNDKKGTGPYTVTIEHGDRTDIIAAKRDVSWRFMEDFLLIKIDHDVRDGGSEYLYPTKSIKKFMVVPGVTVVAKKIKCEIPVSPELAESMGSMNDIIMEEADVDEVSNTDEEL